MKNEKQCPARYVCWINDDEKIISFHQTEGFRRKEFRRKELYYKYCDLLVSQRYRIQ